MANAMRTLLDLFIIALVVLVKVAFLRTTHLSIIFSTGLILVGVYGIIGLAGTLFSWKRQHPSRISLVGLSRKNIRDPRPIDRDFILMILLMIFIGLISSALINLRPPFERTLRTVCWDTLFSLTLVPMLDLIQFLQLLILGALVVKDSEGKIVKPAPVTRPSSYPAKLRNIAEHASETTLSQHRNRTIRFLRYFAFAMGAVVVVWIFAARRDDIRGSFFTDAGDFALTDGIVLDAEIGERHVTFEGVSYYYDITYEYRVNDQIFQSSQVTFRDKGSGDIRFAKSYIARYPPGSKVTVYYHRKDPDISVLEPEEKLELLPSLATLGLILLFFWGSPILAQYIAARNPYWKTIRLIYPPGNPLSLYSLEVQAAIEKGYLASTISFAAILIGSFFTVVFIYTAILPNDLWLSTGLGISFVVSIVGSRMAALGWQKWLIRQGLPIEELRAAAKIAGLKLPKELQ